MLLAVLTASADPAASTSALAEAAFDGLFDALAARGHQVVEQDVAARSAPSRVGPRDGAAQDPLELMARSAEAGHAFAVSVCGAGAAPEAIVCDGTVSGMAAHAVAAACGAPVVLWTGTADLPSDATARRMALAVLRSCALVMATSAATARGLEGRRVARRTAVVGPAVDTTVFSDPGWRDAARSVDGGPLLVRVVGRHAQAVAEQLQAEVADIAVEPLDMHARLPLRPGARASAVLRDALRSADVVVTGLGPDGGRATLRAMACGRPVVTFDRLPDAEIVLDGASGAVLRSAHDLASTVSALAQDPFRREALGQGALDRVLGAHTPDTVATRLEAEIVAAVRDNARQRQSAAG